MGPPRRADILALSEKKLLIIEAKGLEGSAREANLRQAIRWKADVEAVITADSASIANDPDFRQYAESLSALGIELHQSHLEIECYPLMVIGTFRNLPLEERQEMDFPDGVARIINRSNVTALSGLTLYDLLMRARENSSVKQDLRQLLTVPGVLEGRDWRNYLQRF